MRKSTPRVRTGCKTCRIRRVKCDEAKPSCLKCTQTGRKCDGYAKHAAPTPVAREPPTGTSPGLIAVKAYSIPFRMPGSQRDRQLLHYFCVQGAHEFSGFIDNEFWSKTALYASQNETIVRQSLIALSSLHLDLSRPGPSGVVTVGKETLMQYGKALRSLQTRINKAGRTSQARFETAKTALICCVLFYCFESSMGDTQAAMNHLDNGLRLLATHLRDQTDDDDEMASLRDTLGRLDMQATFFDDGRTPTLTLVSPTERDTGLIASREAKFFGLGDAQRLLIKLSNWLLHFLLENLAYQDQASECIPAAVLAEKDRLTMEFDLWAQRYGVFMRGFPPHGAKGPGGPSSGRAAGILLVQHSVLKMLLASKVPSRPEIFGAVPNRAAQGILQLCEGILQSGSRGEAERSASEGACAVPRSLSSETGVVVPLFLLAMKCADERVTDSAVELLVASQRREGLYDAVAVASLVGQLKGVMHQRRQQSEELGLGGSQEDSLEHWVADLLDQSPGGASTLAAMLD